MEIFPVTSQSELGVFALGLIIAGAVSGLAAGALGIGGGIVIIPVLYHVMTALGVGAGVRMHVAVGTALAAAIPAALTTARAARSEVAWKLLRVQVASVLAGTVAGCTLVALAKGGSLTVLFALAALPVLPYLVFERKRRTPNGAATESIFGFCIFLSVLMGTALTRLAIDLIRGTDLGSSKPNMDENRATASALALIVATAGTVTLIVAGWNAPDLPPDSIGYVNLLGFALIAPVLLATEPAGAALAHIMDLRRLRLVFAGLVAITTARMLWDAFV
ncbi:MAG TPA: TSUP family transporter [Rhizomicrobium sp.]|nr:TSUP family transporter [Rhizomicrobium sp.]